MAVAMEGLVVPGIMDPRTAFGGLVNIRGDTIKTFANPVEQEPKPPMDMGEKRHLDLLSAIKGINISEDVQQSIFSEALPSNRDWRR